MTHPLADALHDYLDPGNSTCPECGSSVFDVALEGPQYVIDVHTREVQDTLPFGTVLKITAVQCHGCGEAL